MTRRHRAGGVERLSRQDVGNLRVEARGMPMHVAGLAIVEGAPLCDADGRLRLDVVRRAVNERLPLAPRLRQVLHQPGRGLGRPVWVDAPDFRIDDHVRGHTVAPPGDEASLLAACSKLNEPPLDRSRPLWEVWALSGLADGNVALLFRLHHALADGVASVALLGSMFDLVAGAPPPPAPVRVAVPVPSARELLADRIGELRRGWSRVVSAIAHPLPGLRRIGATLPRVAELLRGGLAPRSSLNLPVGTHRRLLLARADLDLAKSVAHAHGGKVTDVVLAAVAGGARELLLARGELTPDLVLRASVPVSLRASGAAPAAGNQVGVMIVPLPVGEADPFRRLESIARSTAEWRRRPRASMSWNLGSTLVQRGAIHVMNHQRVVNLFVSNVPGPPVPLYFAGARVLEVFQVGVLQGNISLAVGVLSYAGRVGIDVVADADVCPDASVFADGLRTSLRELGVAGVAGPVGRTGAPSPTEPSAHPFRRSISRRTRSSANSSPR